MTKQKGSLWLLLAILLTAAISPLAYASEQQVIQSVSVQINLPEGQELHPEIEERVRESISTVASAVLTGHEISIVRRTQGEISQLVKTVFNRVVRGYRILDIKMAVGERTIILLELQPTSILIEQVLLNLQVHGLSDKIVHVVNREVAAMNEQVEELMIGLPVEALVWADDVIEPILYSLIEYQLPGFTPKLSINIGREVHVDLELEPRGELVEDIQVDLQTSSLPRMLIPSLERRVERELQMFYGLPVAFLQHYEERVYQAINDALDEERWSRHLYLNDRPELELGQTTQLALDVEWIDYQIDFVSELNLGWNAPDSGLELTLGKKFTPWLMLKLKDDFTFRRPTGTLSVGVDVNLGAGFRTDVEYLLRDGIWNTALDWRRDRYGLTVSQSFPGDFPELRLAVNYYPALSSQVSFMYEKDKLWVAWRQTL